MTFNEFPWAYAEGWTITVVNGHFQVLALKHVGKFKNDESVWTYLYREAESGSERHQDVLDWLSQNAPAEFDALIRFNLRNDEAYLEHMQQTLVRSNLDLACELARIRVMIRVWEMYYEAKIDTEVDFVLSRSRLGLKV